MDKDFADILKQIGFTDGLHVPVANEENRRLQKEVEEKLRLKAELLVKLEIQDEQNKRVKKQINNLKNQKEQNQQLIVALKNQHDTELVMMKESEFSIKKTEQNIRNMDKQIQDSEEKQHFLQEDIARSMKKLDHLKALVEWGEEARRAWQEELEAGERDFNMLQRFKLEDDAKFKEMELKRQRLKADVNEREAILANELNMLTTLENQLEQVSRLFRRAHKERMSLISYWENAIKILNQRDNAIDTTLQELQDLKELARGKFATLAEERKFYETQCQNNEELRKQLDELNERVIHQRNVNLEQSEITSKLKSEVVTVRGVMSDMETTINQERSRNSQLANELKLRNSFLLAQHKPIKDLKQRLHELEAADLSAAQRTKEIEDMLKVAERNNKDLQIKFDKIQEKVFEKTSELESLKKTNEMIENEIKVFNLNTKAFEKRVNEIEKEIIDKEQVLYNLDMETMVLESQLGRLQGERTDEEKYKFKMRIVELEDAVKKKKEVLNLVTAQFNKAKNEQIQLSAEVEEENEQSRKLTEKRQELVYMMEGGQKELTTLQQSNKQTQVTLNLLKLRVDQREKTLAKHENQVFGLEREKLELENALRERKVEIGLQMDLMGAKRRSLEEEKSELKKALEHLQMKVVQLQKKHDIVMDSLGKEDTGENFSVAYFKIKMAQERHELQEIGDDLDSKIKKAENEIPAMENTLRVISAANDCYKRNLDAIDSNSPEMQEKKKLEEQMDEANRNLKDRQAVLKDVTIRIHELEFSLSELAECEERLRSEWRDKDIAARALDKELEEQQAKLSRADKLLRKLKREARDSRIPLVQAQKDIELRELQDINQSGLQQLAELATRYSEVAPLLNRYLGEKGLSLPLVRTSRSKIGASCSSLSTHRSLFSEDSRVSMSSGPSSQVPSVIMLDPDFNHPDPRSSRDSKSSRLTGSQRKNK